MILTFKLSLRNENVDFSRFVALNVIDESKPNASRDLSPLLLQKMLLLMLLLLLFVGARNSSSGHR